MSGSNSSSYQSNFSSNQNSSSSSGDQFGFGGEEQKVVLTFAGSGGGATGPNVKSSRSFSARLAHNLYNEGGVDLGIDGRRPAIRKDDGSEFTAEEAKRKAEEEINQHVKNLRSSSAFRGGAEKAHTPARSSGRVPANQDGPVITFSTGAAHGLRSNQPIRDRSQSTARPLPLYTSGGHAGDGSGNGEFGNGGNLGPDALLEPFSRKESDFGSHVKVARSASQANRFFSMFKHQKGGRSSGNHRTVDVSIDRCWDYWRKQLRSPTVFSILTDYNRPLPPEKKSDEITPWAPDMAVVNASRSIKAEISANMVNSIKALSLDTHSTLFEVFLAIFQVLLFRYSRETDVTIYTHTGVNVVPLRVPVTGELTFKKLLRLTKICVEQAYHYDLIDVEELAADLGVPNFTYLAFQLELSNEQSDADQQNFIKSHEIGLEVALHPEGMAVLTVHYNPKVFTAETAEQLLTHYIETARNLAHFSNLNSTIAVVPIMSQAESKDITNMLWRDAVNGPLVDHGVAVGHEKEYAYSTDDYLHALFERQAAKTPNAPCIDDEGKVSTYAQVNERANRIAHYLIEKVGVKVGELVATLLPRGGDVYVCQLAIMKAGCGYVCIDSSYPQDRVDYILQDSKARVMITVNKLSGKQKVTGEFILEGKECESLLLSHKNTNPPSREMGLKCSDVCYVIYTSGTTGVPKGVVIEHRCVVNFVRGEACVFGVKSKDRVLQGFSPSFDASVEEIWLAFYAGATLVVGTSETMQSGPNLPQLLYKMGITVISTVPTLLTMFTPSQQKGDVNDLPNIWLLILGGEACPAELVTRWAPGRRLINSYGPTEATVVSTFEQSKVGKRVTIGKPLPNYTCYILDANMQPCPVGVPGELHIGGVALARGYLNLPDKTAEKFIPNPFAHHSDSVPRLYKTGDLVRYLRDGDIEFLGRIDSQVKLRGFRVELSEIESVICQLDYVRSAVVAVKGQNLLAFIVPKDPNAKEEEQKHGSVFVEDPNSLLLDVETDHVAASFDMGGTREYMKKMLPHYMMPGQLILVKDIPSLPSGKADRKTLLAIQVKAQPKQVAKKKVSGDVKRAAAAPDATVAAAAAAMESDDDDADDDKLSVMEKQMQGIWEDVLGQAPIGVDEDFFTDLGGHSVVAALVISALRKKDFVVSMRELYENSTIRKFCKALEAQVNESKKEDTPQQCPPLPEYDGPRVGWFKDYFVWFFQTFIIACGFYWLGYVRLGLYYLARYIADSDWFEFNWRSALIIGASISTAFTAVTLVSFIGLVGIKMLVIGELREGAYPIWGWYHLRWWAINKITATFPMLFFRNTWVQKHYYRLMGATIGSDVYIGTIFIYDFDLVTIEDGASIGTQARICPHRYEDGMLILERIHIGKDCYVGPRAAVGGGVVMEEGSQLEALSLLPNGYVLEEYMQARGSPAKVVGPAVDMLADTRDDDDNDDHDGYRAHNDDGNDDNNNNNNNLLLPSARLPRRDKGVCCNSGCSGWTFVFIAQFFSIPLHGFFTLYPYIPAAIVTYYYFGPPHWSFKEVMVLAPPVVFASVIVFILINVVMARLVCWSFEPGVYSINSRAYFRKWFMDLMTDIMVTNLQTLYATVYTPLYLRMMGMHIGKSVEASTIFDYVPNLTYLDDECFVADHVALGSARYDRGYFELRTTIVGSRTFVGNNAVLVSGSHLSRNSLIGVNSVPPLGEMADNTSWIGSPSFLLPSRKVAEVDEDATFNPPCHVYLHRAIWEFFKVMFPPFLSSANYGAFLFALAWSYEELDDFVDYVFISPLWGVAASAGTLAVVFLLKWYLIGKFKQRNYALWSVEVWRAEFVQALEENVVAPAFLIYALGSWWAVAWFRLLGANIGERVYLDSIYLCESDLVNIDDDAIIEAGATIQTHLFEDRVMKMEPLHIGKGACVGANSVVLYSSRIEDNAVLDQCSLAMKGETLMPALKYEGIPAVAAMVHEMGDRERERQKRKQEREMEERQRRRKEGIARQVRGAERLPQRPIVHRGSTLNGSTSSNDLSSSSSSGYVPPKPV